MMELQIKSTLYGHHMIVTWVFVLRAMPNVPRHVDKSYHFYRKLQKVDFDLIHFLST